MIIIKDFSQSNKAKNFNRNLNAYKFHLNDRVSKIIIDIS